MKDFDLISYCLSKDYRSHQKLYDFMQFWEKHVLKSTYRLKSKSVKNKTGLSLVLYVNRVYQIKFILQMVGTSVESAVFLSVPLQGFVFYCYGLYTVQGERVTLTNGLP